jgi:hypothetical protein
LLFVASYFMRMLELSKPYFFFCVASTSVWNAQGTAPDFAPTACIWGLLASTGRSEGRYWK